MQQPSKSQKKSPLILVINAGSTSTKTALYRGRKAIMQESVHHPLRSLRTCRRVKDQTCLRVAAVARALKRAGIAPADLDAVAARGGLLSPCPRGTYLIDRQMVRDLKSGRYGEHASNLGTIIAYRIAAQAGVPAYVVDPPVVDELCAEARFSGIPEISRRAVWHALNQKVVAQLVARKLGRPYHRLNLIIAHLGGGTSVAAHRRGRAIDVNNALDGDGPFAIERSGGLPAADLVRFAAGRAPASVHNRINGCGGVTAYLGTNDMRSVEQRARVGDLAARTVLNALAYQTAKEIGACAAVLAGRVDALVLTGSLARCVPLTQRIRRRVQFIAPLYVIPGEMEMKALTEGVLRVMSGQEAPRSYMPGPSAHVKNP